tara:strand:+ start:77 stop:625 length:549 start_codon:yes stop_codon:yes gene_type:complete
VIVELHNFLSNELCDEIKNACTQKIEKDKITCEYNRQGNSVEITQDNLKDIDQKYFIKITDAFNKRLVYDFNLSGTPVKDTGYEYHIYKPGEGAHPHFDGVFASHLPHPRILSIVTHLTTNENAPLIFPRMKKVVQTEKGKLVAFLPHNCYDHYCYNNSQTDREVLVTWFVDENYKIEKWKE